MNLEEMLEKHVQGIRVCNAKLLSAQPAQVAESNLM